MRKKEAWRCSLHGGHSGQFCDHARGTLREVIEAAIAAGIDTFGVSEHAPRTEDRFLYDEELALGWTSASFETLFGAYIAELRSLAEEYADRIAIVRGFELEVVPEDRHIAIMQAWRAAGGFVFAVGSVHYVRELQVDGPRPAFEVAIEELGGIEPLAVAYYDRVAQMVADLRPEVVGHLDLIRKNGIHYGLQDTPSIEAAQDRALEAVRTYDGILDLNTAGWRKGLGTPYPGPALVRRAAAMGIPFCFGDDSHGPDDVGAGLDEARAYLLGLGVETITTLTPDGDRRVVPLR